MLEVKIYDEAGKAIGSERIDPALLGGEVNPALLKQAIVMYHAHQRQGDARQKSRGEVHGSSRKLFRQKGTGRARMGNARTPVRKGGGVAFPRRPRAFRKDMPRQMRQLACRQAVLAKIQGEAACVVDGLSYDAPKTKRLAATVGALGGEKGCVLATDGIDRTVYLSGRNIPRCEVMNVADLNAFAILSRKQLIFTKAAFETFRSGLKARPAKVAAAAPAKQVAAAEADAGKGDA